MEPGKRSKKSPSGMGMRKEQLCGINWDEGRMGSAGMSRWRLCSGLGAPLDHKPSPGTAAPSGRLSLLLQPMLVFGLGFSSWFSSPRPAGLSK